MTTPDQHPEPSISGSTITPILDSISKATATGAILLYICGFLITSIYHAQYGIVQNNPFRPRIVAAGGWFLLLSVIPVWTVIYSMGKARVPWSFFLKNLFSYWVVCCTLSIFPAMLFAYSERETSPFNWLQISALLVAVAVFTGLFQIKKLHKAVLPIVSVSLTLFFLGWSIENLARTGKFGYSSIIIWFFGIGFATMLELMSFDPPKLADPRWIRTFFFGLFLLFIFAGAYYPNLRASWGGGAPVAVTIYFTKDSVIRPGSSVNVLLVDEDDIGVYIKGLADKKAFFVPRGYIALISFSDSSNKAALINSIQGTVELPAPSIPH